VVLVLKQISIMFTETLNYVISIQLHEEYTQHPPLSISVDVLA